jgi:hypothetical protein
LVDLLINLIASVIAGLAVWLYQYASRYQRLARTRDFLGVRGNEKCLVSIPRHTSSSRENSVHRLDLATVVEVATLLERAGGETDLDISDRDTRGVAIMTEFCIGGPHANERTAAHLRQFAPGVHIAPWSESPDVRLTVGDTVFDWEQGEREHVLVFKIVFEHAPKNPLWIICGQVAIANQAAARFIKRNLVQLRKRYKSDQSFCLALRIADSKTYGYENVEELLDCTRAAFKRSPVS